MKEERRPDILPKLVVSAFFIAYFIYFAIFNRYSLAYNEQIQLFRFDWSYFISFLTKPGGFVNYLSTFFIQFYLYPIVAVSIITLTGISTYVLTNHFFKQYNISGIIWSLFPVMLLMVLQSDYTYSLADTLGFLIVLIFSTLYIHIRNLLLRYITGFTGLMFLYLATGGFSLLATLLCVIHELFFTKNHYRFFIAAGYALAAAVFPFLAWYLIYFMPLDHAWLSSILFPINKITLYGLLLLFAYIPLLLIVTKIWSILSKRPQVKPGWNRKTVIAGIVILLLFSWVMKRYAYNPRNELLFRIDNNIQREEWNNVLKISSRYPDSDRLILYFINLALYKSGKLGDEMFHYNQKDVSYLWLAEPETDFPYFFGCNIFYHLGYTNKAYAWAYDAMVATGYAPRLLKQLVLTSLINDDNAIAEKYLNVLDQSLFYRKWAQHYLKYLSDPNLLLQDQEIKEKRQLLLNKDFVANANNPDSVLVRLLDNHPDNRMAFEYYMASLLLNKNVSGIVANINNLKYYGYKEIPIHYEEALLEYMYSTHENVVPEGYLIRKSTDQRFKNFVNAYTFNSDNLNLAAQKLYKPFGTTYWYYLNFINNEVEIR